MNLKSVSLSGVLHIQEYQGGLLFRPRCRFLFLLFSAVVYFVLLCSVFHCLLYVLYFVFVRFGVLSLFAESVVLFMIKCVFCVMGVRFDFAETETSSEVKYKEPERPFSSQL